MYGMYVCMYSMYVCLVVHLVLLLVEGVCDEGSLAQARELLLEAAIRLPQFIHCLLRLYICMYVLCILMH